MALEYYHHWGIEAQVIRGTKCGVYTSSTPSNIASAVADIPCSVTKDMNTMLQEGFTRGEVDVALNQMDSLKAPRPDGMPHLFLQHYWCDIGDEVSTMVLTCLNTGSIP